MYRHVLVFRDDYIPFVSLGLLFICEDVIYDGAPMVRPACSVAVSTEDSHGELINLTLRYGLMTHLLEETQPL
jgi:hypothetical protein